MQLTKELAQTIFEQHQIHSFRRIDNSHVELNPAQSHGTLAGVDAGLEILLTENIGVSSATAIAKIWGKSNLHIERIDDAHASQGHHFIIFHSQPNFREDFFRGAGQSNISSVSKLKSREFDSD